MPLFLAAAVALLARSRYRVDEIGEYLLGLGMLCVMAAYCLRCRQPGRRAIRIGASWGAFVAATLLLVPLGLGAAQGRAWTREIFQYYLYSFAIERFPQDGRWNDSRQLLEYAADHGFTNRQTQLWLARAATQMGDSSAAATFLRRAAAESAADLEQQPQDPFALCTSGLVAREMRQTARADSFERRAIDTVEAALRSRPDNDVLEALLAHLGEDVGDEVLAGAAFDRVSARHPGVREDFRYLLWTGREDEAVQRGRF